jgi:murein DD-endopeptidase MepM/ murein hydrolase activator NlpD
VPDVAKIDTTTWGIYNGIETQPGAISKGRLNPEYVHEEARVRLPISAEQDSFLDIYINGSLYITLDNNLNCDAGTDVLIDNVIVKFGSICKLDYNFAFNSGERGYVFQVIARDLAGNQALISEGELVYFDKTNPRNPEILNASSSSYNKIPQWRDSNQVQYGNGVTKDLQTTLKSYNEPLTDLQYWAYNIKNEQYKYDYYLNDGDGFTERSFNLGTTSDERVGCVKVENGRRVGICEDGMYRFALQATDAPGNKSQTTQISIERDTVKPAEPQATLSICGNNICSTVNSGEPGSTVVVQNSVGTITSQGKTAPLVILRNFEQDRDYRFPIRLRDSAGNLSDITWLTIHTPSFGIGGMSDEPELPLNSSLRIIDMDIKIDADGRIQINDINIPAPIITFAQTAFGSSDVYLSGRSILTNLEALINLKITKETPTYGEAIDKCGTNYLVINWSFDTECLSRHMQISASEFERFANQTAVSCFNQYPSIPQFFSRINCMRQQRITRSIRQQAVESFGQVMLSLYKADSLNITDRRKCEVGASCQDSMRSYLQADSLGKWQMQFNKTDLQPGDIVKAKLKLFGSVKFSSFGQDYELDLSQGSESEFGNKVQVPQPEDFFSTTVHPLASDINCNGFSRTSKFGNKESFRTSPHQGVDLAKGSGCMINSIGAGTVIYRDHHVTAGNMIVVEHSPGLSTAYLHGKPATFAVTRGQYVSRYQPLMFMGRTGRVTGVHLHFELTIGGKNVDSELTQYLGDLSKDGNLFMTTKKY